MWALGLLAEEPEPTHKGLPFSRLSLAASGIRLWTHTVTNPAFW